MAVHLREEGVGWVRRGKAGVNGKLRKSRHCIKLPKVSTRTFTKFRKDEKDKKARGS